MERICLTEEEKEKAISIAQKRVMVNVFALALIIVISCIIGVFGFSVRLLVVYVFWGFIGAVIGYGLLQNITAKPGEYVHFVKMGERYYSVGIYKNQELDE